MTDQEKADFVVEMGVYAYGWNNYAYKDEKGKYWAMLHGTKVRMSIEELSTYFDYLDGRGDIEAFLALKGKK